MTSRPDTTPLQNKEDCSIITFVSFVITYLSFGELIMSAVIEAKKPQKTNFLKEVITKEVLELKHGSSHDIDHLFAENYDKAVADGKLINVCCKITPELFDRLSGACAFLSISKRKFIELAIIQGLDEASTVMDEYGLFDHLASESEAMKKWSEERKSKEGATS